LFATQHLFEKVVWPLIFDMMTVPGVFAPRRSPQQTPFGAFHLGDRPSEIIVYSHVINHSQ
jgi:hypothetical protein